MRLTKKYSLRSPVSYRAPLIDVRFTARLLLCTTLCATLIAISYPQTSSAAILRQLPFSARLKSASSDLPVSDGNYSITFSIYTTETNGTPVWTETQTVSVTEGVISVNLGSATGFPTNLTFNDDTYYLGIKIGSDAEMSPRKRIGSVPTALNADTVDGAHAGTEANNVLLLDSSGNINIQGSASFGGSVSVATLISGAGTLTLPTTTDTLVGRATTDTLTNKTITSPIIQGTVSAGSGLTLPAFTASGNITGSGAPTLSGFGTINGASLSGTSVNGLSLASGIISNPTINGTITTTTTLTLPAVTAGGSIAASSSAYVISGFGTINGATISGGTISGGSLSDSGVNGVTVAAGVITGGTWQGNAIGRAYGGTGITTYTAGDILYAPANDTIGKLAAGGSNEGKILKVVGGLPTWSSEGASGGDITSVLAGTGLTGGGTTGDVTLNLDTSSAITWSVNGAASTPAQTLSGTWYSGGSSTTTTPQLLIQPSGTASTGWNTAGTGLGINAASGFTGNLADLQLAGTSKFKVDASGNITAGGDLTLNGNFSVTGSSGTTTIGGALDVTGNTTLTGSLTANGNVTLGNATSDTITFGGAIASSLIPDTTATYDLGSASNKFRKIYAEEVIYDTTTTISTTSDNIVINSDAAGDEDSWLEFYRGGSLTAAKLLWDSANDQFDFNNSLLVQGNTTLGDANTDTTTLRGAVTLQDSSSIYTLLFGADTNLYRSAANTLKTDDAFTVTGALTVASNSVNGATITGGTLSAGSFTGGAVSGGTLSGTAMQGTGSFTITGGTASGETLTLVSTSNATKGDIQFFSSSNKITSGGNLTVAGTVNGASISGGTISGGALSAAGVSGTGWNLSATQVNGLQVDSSGLITGGATWNGNSIGAAYGGTGINTSSSTGIATVSSGTWSIQSSLGATVGGTGQTTVTTGDLLYGSATNTWSKLSAVSSGAVLISNGAGVAPSWSTSPTLSTSLTVPTVATASGALTLQAASGTTKLLTSATNATLEIYGSGGTNKLVLSHDNTNAIISSTSGELQLGGQGTNQLLIGEVGTAVNLVFEESSTISGQGGNTITFGQSGDVFNMNTSGVTYNIGTLSATNAILNTSSTSSAALVINGPTSMSASLLDLQVNGSSKASISAAGVLTSTGLTSTGTNTFSGQLAVSTNGAASTPAIIASGTWYTGGSATTTKPQLLIEPTGTTSTGWSTNGTGLGVNAASGFTGNLIDAQIAGVTKFKVDYAGNVTQVGNIAIASANVTGTGTSASFSVTGNSLTTGNALSVSSSSLTTGSLVDLTVTSNAGNTNNKVLNISTSGTNSGTGSSTYGLYASNTRTNSGVNYGGYFTASGGSTNWAMASAGNVLFNPEGSYYISTGRPSDAAIGFTNSVNSTNYALTGNGTNYTTLNAPGASGAIAFAVNGSQIGQLSTVSSVNTLLFSGAGAVTGTSSLTLDSSTTGAVNLGSGNNAKTVTIGGGTGGKTINIGTNNSNADTIAIGSALDTVTVTGSTFAIDTADWDVTTAGVFTGVSGITSDGGYTQSGTTANTFTGASSFTASGTALSVTNNATVGGVLTVPTIATASGALTLQSASGTTKLLTSATNATLEIYGSGGTNKLSLSHDNTNGIITSSAGELQLTGQGTNQFIIGDVGTASNLVFEESSTISGQGGNTITLGQSGDIFNMNTLGVTYNIGTLAATNAVLNTSSTSSAALVVNGPTSLSSNILDLQVNSVSKASINAAGLLTSAGLTSSGTSTFTGQVVASLNGAASTPPITVTGTWYTGGSATTTKPQLLIEPTGTTSTGWGTSGTGLGINAASAFTGNLLDTQLAGTSKFKVTYQGAVTAASTLTVSSGGVTVTTGGVTVTGNSTITGTLGNLTGLTSSGTITFSGLSNGIVSATSGVLSTSSSLGATLGGTGQTTVTTGDLLYGSASNTWGKLSAVASGSILVSNGTSTAPSWSATPTVTSLAATTLTASTHTSTGALAVTTASNGNISLTPNGTGDIVINTDSDTDLLIGDGGSTNYAKFDSNGSLTFAGAARPYGELFLLPQDAYVTGAGQCTLTNSTAAGSDTAIQYQTLDCDATAKDAFWQFRMPQNYVNNSNLQVDVSWFSDATSSTSTINAAYAAVSAGGTWTSASLTDTAGSAQTTSGANKINTSTITISAPSISAGDMVSLRSRVSAQGLTGGSTNKTQILKVRLRFLVGS